jgi:hypothetical protein
VGPWCDQTSTFGAQRFVKRRKDWAASERSCYSSRWRFRSDLRLRRKERARCWHCKWYSRVQGPSGLMESMPPMIGQSKSGLIATASIVNSGKAGSIRIDRRFPCRIPNRSRASGKLNQSVNFATTKTLIYPSVRRLETARVLP